MAQTHAHQPDALVATARRRAPSPAAVAPGAPAGPVPLPLAPAHPTHLQATHALDAQDPLARLRPAATPAATTAAAALGAEAYATGDRVAFADTAPSLHTAAHEAAHVIQQQAGVQL